MNADKNYKELKFIAKRSKRILQRWGKKGEEMLIQNKKDESLAVSPTET